MRIGLVVPGFSADPTDWCIPALRNLAQGLAATDEVRVLALRYPYSAGRYEVFGARVTALGGGGRRGWSSAAVWRRTLATLASEHRRRRFEVLHAFWANETGALTALAGRVLGVPTVVSLAGGELVALPEIAYGGQLARVERFKVRLALRLADLVTAGSDCLLRQAAPWLASRPAEGQCRAPLGVDLDLFRPARSGAGVGPPRLVHVASLIPVKDQVTLLQAVARVRPLGRPFVLDVVGAGLLEAPLRALAEQLGLKGSVQFRGALPHDRLPSVYQSGAWFVLSSRHEAQGMAVLEAAACGLPAISTRVGVAPELAPDAARTVPIGDPQALADALAEALSDPEQQATMGGAARARVEAEFGLAARVAGFRQLYDQAGSLRRKTDHDRGSTHGLAPRRSS